MSNTQPIEEQPAAGQPCATCAGIGMAYLPGLVADDGFDEGMDECPACTGDRFCPKCGGEMHYPADLDPDDDDDETDTCQRCGFVWDAEARAIASAEVQARIMNPEHPRWREFLKRLEGPEGCNFRLEGEDFHWNCNGQDDRPYSRAILADMGGLDVGDTLSYFDQHGGHCDCEVVFNVEPDDTEEPE